METSCKKYLFLGFLLCVSVAIAQKKNIVTDKLLENAHTWSEGSVMLTDGTELKGLVRYDDNFGVLHFQDGELSKTLIAKSVAGFEFFDETIGKQRIFYSLESDRSGTKKFQFFEVVKELKEFALLSSLDEIKVETRQNNNPGYLTPTGAFAPNFVNTKTTEVSQTETIYVMTPDGKLRPYVKIIDRESDGLFVRTKSKNKFIDEDLFVNLTGKHYRTLQKYARENDLDFRVKSHLVKILEHYEALLQNLGL